ncbi:MAG TPA: FecR domain-containing protein [Croceicoccus sp.]|nr:FecR domain-containing protein [Croceicoccus sp.]
MAIDDSGQEAAIRAEALDWAVRTGDARFAEWEAFTAWLERDPRHALAYDTVVVATHDAVDTMRAAMPANDDAPVPVAARPQRRWLGGVVAMALVLVAGVGLWRVNAPDHYTVETAPGTMRTVDLGQGTQVAVAGGSRIRFDRNDPRYASLETGRAVFIVRHDESDPFRVTVGPDTLVDVGTVFEVRYDDAAFSLAVSEGAVQFNPDGANVHVAAGQQLARTASGLQLSPIAGAQVGEWREGRLTFEAQPLSAVARDLTRATGIAFTVGAKATGQPVSGSILIDPVRRDPASLGPLLGVRMTRQGEGWMLGSP